MDQILGASLGALTTLGLERCQPVPDGLGKGRAVGDVIPLEVTHRLVDQRHRLGICNGPSSSVLGGYVGAMSAAETNCSQRRTRSVPSTFGEILLGDFEHLDLLLQETQLRREPLGIGG